MSEERYLEQEINKDLKILDLERQLEDKEVLLKAYSEALKTHQNHSQVQTIIDTNLRSHKKLLTQHSQYKLKEKGGEI